MLDKNGYTNSLQKKEVKKGLWGHEDSIKTKTVGLEATTRPDLIARSDLYVPLRDKRRGGNPLERAESAGHYEPVLRQGNGSPETTISLNISSFTESRSSSKLGCKHSSQILIQNVFSNQTRSKTRKVLSGAYITRALILNDLIITYVVVDIINVKHFKILFALLSIVLLVMG